MAATRREAATNAVTKNHVQGPAADSRGSLSPTSSAQAMISVLYLALLIATVVAVDVLFFRNQFWERLTVNVGIVLVFSAFYFRFLKRS